MQKEQGNLSISSENIFPIIKKWLYSDHDIFFRELISNGSDAITKLKKLEMIGECTLPDDNEYKIQVFVNPEEKTVSVVDNGIGMTADEVKEYINQIAFSGAADFLDKYKDKANEDQIIGHFGLGFYSTFMVAHKVTIDTLSWQEGAEAVHWESEEGVDFALSGSDRTDRGTKVTLYLNEDSYEFSNEYRAKEIIEKYCSFIPIPIFFKNETAPDKEEPDDEEDEGDDKKSKKSKKSKSDVIDAEVDEDGKAVESKKEKKGPKPINDTSPLWAKHPNDCTDEEYKEFYRKVFHDYKEPLFWIHLNMDYPFNLKGILYFPKINMEYESIEGKIKLYSNQVFIADNIKEVIPEFLLLLKGTIDCPDLPLNVSRSALQNDGFVKKISDYITKKVADKLTGMYKVERENYEKFWDDISPFIKFGCLKEDKFREKMKDFMIFRNLEKKFVTLPEYLESMKDKTFEKPDGEEDDDADKDLDEDVIDGADEETGTDIDGGSDADGIDETDGDASEDLDKDEFDGTDEGADEDEDEFDETDEDADEDEDDFDETDEEADEDLDTDDSDGTDEDAIKGSEKDGEGSKDDVAESKKDDAKSKKDKKRLFKKKKDKDSDESKEPPKQVVYYVTDEQQQSQYVNMFKEEGIDALLLTHNIDQPFITQLERDNENVKFQRIDAELTGNFKEELEGSDLKKLKKEKDALTKLFRKVLKKDKLEVSVERMKNDKISAIVTLSEENRRMQDMMRMYSMGGPDMGMFGTQETLVLNSNHALVKYILEKKNDKNDKHTSMICEQLYDLAMISHKPLEPEAMTKFVERTNEIMMMLTTP